MSNLNYGGADACAKAPQKSPIEDAFSRLASEIENAELATESLFVRLQPVSQSRPASESNGTPCKPDACEFEGRVNRMVERIRAVSDNMRSLRENLCL